MNNTTRGSVSYLGSEFDSFLYASIDVEKNGMPLSVLSALARQKIDPWFEAAKLAELPQKTAIQKLTSSIAALPDWPSTHLDFEAIAARLIMLLPRRDFSLNSHGQNKSASKTTNIYSVAIQYAFFVFILLLLLNAEWIWAAHQPDAQADINVSEFHTDLPVNTNANRSQVSSMK